ncbi:MAG: DJ-1 family glyoxalase III [Spirochaetaceae bacterium]
MKRTAVLLADGFEEVEGLLPVDYLRRSGVDVSVLGVTGKQVTGGHDIRVDTDMKVEDADGAFDAVYIPGGFPGVENIAASTAAKELIKSVYEKGELVAAICAAPAFVLEPMGIIEGKKVTCFPGAEEKLKTSTFVEERVVKDGKFLTSRGPGTAGEFAVEIIRFLLGDEKAEELRSKTLTRL